VTRSAESRKGPHGLIQEEVRLPLEDS